MGPVHLGEDAVAASRECDGGLQLDCSGELRFGRLDRDQAFDLIESGLGLVRRFDGRKSSYLRRRRGNLFFGVRRDDKCGYVLRLDTRIGVRHQLRRRGVGARRMRVIRRVYGMNVVAARM